jgi:electron transfer flavoprotein beta subunit
MKVVVCVKHVPDVAEIKIDQNTRAPILAGVPYKISDFDKNALEEAIKIKEKHGASVSVVSMGAERVKEGLKEALAMGADDGYAVIFNSDDNLVNSKVLAKAIEKIGFDLIVCGEASIDGYSGEIPPRLSEILGIPQVTYAQKISVEGEKVMVERDMEDGIEEVEANTPCLISVLKTINEPRLPTIMQILSASKKTITTLSLGDLGISEEITGEAGIMVLENISPPSERKGIIFEGDDAIEQFAHVIAKEVG